MPLPLGQYQVRVTARNLPAASSTGQTVTSTNLPSTFFVTTPPQVLTPNVGIYDTTPEVTWTVPLGGIVSEVEVIFVLTGEIVYLQDDIAGSSAIITRAGIDAAGNPIQVPLEPGEYRVRVRSSTTGNVSDCIRLEHASCVPGCRLASATGTGRWNLQCSILRNRGQASDPDMGNNPWLAKRTQSGWLT